MNEHSLKDDHWRIYYSFFYRESNGLKISSRNITVKKNLSNFPILALDCRKGIRGKSKMSSVLRKRSLILPSFLILISRTKKWAYNGSNIIVQVKKACLLWILVVKTTCSSLSIWNSRTMGVPFVMAMFCNFFESWRCCLVRRNSPLPAADYE